MRYGKLCAGACVSALWLGAGFVPATAQTNTQIASNTGLETVIVTASKRAEDAQTVPISITAFNQDELNKLGVATIQDLKFAAPSVYIAPTAFRQGPNTGLRSSPASRSLPVELPLPRISRLTRVFG